jgi:hypothetical protein
MDEPTDYQGCTIPPGETPETIIKIWEIDPHPLRRNMCLWERSYQKMLAYVGSNLEHLCERDEVDEPDGLTITVRVIWMSKREYEEAVTDE